MNKVFSKFVNYGFGALFSLIILLSVYSLSEFLTERGIIQSRATALTGVIAIFAVAAALCFGLDALQKTLEKKIGGNAKLCDRIFIMIALALLAVQCLFALTTDFSPINDLKYVSTAARNYIAGGADNIYTGLPKRHQQYFAVYPNNHMLFLIVLALYKIQYAVTGTVSNFLPIAFNLLGLNLSYILMYKCARLIYSPEKSLVCAIKGLMFLPLITYAPFFYTDSVGMPWLTGAFYLYMKWRKVRSDETSRTKCAALLLACGAVLAVAYKIKGSAVIMIPAVILDLIFTQKGIKDKLLPIAEIAVVFALISSLLGGIACSVLKISDEELDRYSFPAVHWVMMSADDKGGYNYEDFKYTKSFEGKSEKVHADIDRLNEKISKQGVSGFIDHLALKLSYTWKDGTYMINYYIRNSNLLMSNTFMILSTLTHFTLIICMAKSYITKLRSNDDVLSGNFFLKVTLMGLTVFLMLWEARCRYLVSFFLLFALL